MKLRQCLFLALSLTLLGGLVHFAYAIDLNSLLGDWKEKDGKAVYSFKNDHEFEGTFWPYQARLAIKPIGAWQTGSDICWSGNNKGNLSIHVGTKWCCHSAYFLGQNLILRSIVGSGSLACKNRVLIKMPGTERQKR